MSTPTETPAQHAKREAIIAAATRDLGVREIGFTNTGARVDQMLATVGLPPGNSWCAAAVCTWLKAADAIPAWLHTLTGYVPSLANQARAGGALMDAADVASGADTVRGGDIVVVYECYDNPGADGFHHTGIVVSPPDADGNFESIEGNTNADGGSEGYAVMRQTRNLHQLTADGSRARYAFAQTV